MNTRNFAALALGAALLAGTAAPAFASENAPASSASASTERFREDASRLFGTYRGGAIAVDRFSGTEQAKAAALDSNRDGKLDQQEFDRQVFAAN